MRLTKEVRGKTRFFNVSNHAFARFGQRVAIIHRQMQPHECVENFVSVFEAAKKLKIKSKAKKLRDLNNGDVADYYRYKDINFIVVNGTIVTVEFGGEFKYLNKHKYLNRHVS